jgi:guanylate kinase
MINKIRVKDLLKNNKYNLLIICGNSGSGKSYFEKNLSSEYPDLFKKLPQTTTRKPRENEVDGKDYHYIEKELYDKIEPLLIFRLGNFNSNKYGTLPVFNKDRINTVIASYDAIINFIMEKDSIFKDLPLNIILLHMSIDYDNITSSGKRNTRDKEFINDEINANNTLSELCMKADITYLNYKYEDNNRFARIDDIFEI